MQEEFNAELRVEKIEINPFVLSLRINGLELDNPGAKPTIRIQEIFTNFQLSSVFRLAFTFDEIRLSQTELFVTRNNAGDMDFNYLLKSSDAGATPVEDAQVKQESSPVPLLVYNFLIEDFIVNWSDEVATETVKTRFGPINIGVKDLDTLPNRTGKQAAEIATEKIGTLRWEGDLQLNPLRSSARASLKDSQFSLISAYTRDQSSLDIVDGSVDVDLKYEVFETPSGQIEANVSDINLTIVDLVIESFADGTGFDFAGPDQQILQLAKIQISEGALKWPEQNVSIGSISLEDPQISASRDANGIFNLQPRQNLTNTGETTADPQQATSDDVVSDNEWRISVTNLVVNRLSLDLVDQSVGPEANLDIIDFNLAINDISNLPGKFFPTTLDLQAKNRQADSGFRCTGKPRQCTRRRPENRPARNRQRPCRAGHHSRKYHGLERK